MTSPFRDVPAAMQERAAVLQKEIATRRKVISKVTSELNNVRRQIELFREGEPIRPRVIAAVVGAALGIVLSCLSR